MLNDSLGDRMKSFEEVFNQKLLRRCTAILRIDGRAFHTFTKDEAKPFDLDLHASFINSAAHLMSEIGGAARFGYTQSDEVSILLFDCNKFNSSHWFDGKINKINSVGASIFTNTFNKMHSVYSVLGKKKIATFDARVFSIPEEDVGNYFLWRKQDAKRNSILSYVQSKISHKELQGLSCKQILERFPKWNQLPVNQKYGSGINHKGETIEMVINDQWRNETLKREEI